MSRFEVVHGVEGFALLLDDERIAGSKPWGGGDVAIRWETEETFAKVDNGSRWFELFGTPERTALTLEALMRKCRSADVTLCDSCVMWRSCEEEQALLEWLESEVRDD